MLEWILAPSSNLKLNLLETWWKDVACEVSMALSGNMSCIEADVDVFFLKRSVSTSSHAMLSCQDHGNGNMSAEESLITLLALRSRCADSRCKLDMQSSFSALARTSSKRLDTMRVRVHRHAYINTSAFDISAAEPKPLAAFAVRTYAPSEPDQRTSRVPVKSSTKSIQRRV